jgi:hypothetical protein
VSLKCIEVCYYEYAEASPRGVCLLGASAWSDNARGVVDFRSARLNSPHPSFPSIPCRIITGNPCSLSYLRNGLIERSTHRNTKPDQARFAVCAPIAFSSAHK